MQHINTPAAAPKTKLPILPALYLPPAAWFAQTVRHGGCVLAFPPFEKQTLFSRTYIKTANGVAPLIIPTQHQSRRTVVAGATPQMESIGSVCPDGTNWARTHRRSIESAYRRTPFFEYYAEPLLAHYQQPPDTLGALNAAMIHVLCRFLGLRCTALSARSNAPSTRESVYHTAARLSYPPALNRSAPPNFHALPYLQPFGAFAANLSILDLLFNLGPETSLYLQRCSAD